MLLPGDAVFSSRGWWLRNRENLVFRSTGQMEDYQRRRLRYLLAAHRIDRMGHPIQEIPPPKFVEDTFKLSTSGTSSAVQRPYYYPERFYQLIEDHHVWRIEREYGLTQPGVVVDLFYNPAFVITEKGLYQSDPFTREVQYDKPLAWDEPENTLYGPMFRWAVGSHNKFYQFSYHRYTSVETWVLALQRARELCPKFMIMSPSQVQTVWNKTAGQVPFDCPLITTRETLTSWTRDLALRMFPVVIDKMRCWDGGLSFYQCPQGRLHVYDELCLVEEIEGRLVSTDFFNYCHPFVRYANHDTGELDRGLCGCGVYGNYFTKFTGRVQEAVLIGEDIIPGAVFQQEIGKFLTWGNFVSGYFEDQFYSLYPRGVLEGVEVCWQLRQDTAGSLEFVYDSRPSMTPEQVEFLQAGIRFIVLRDPGPFTLGVVDARHGAANHPLSFTVNPSVFDGAGRRSKHLFVQSDLLRSRKDV